jgi:ubiquinone biosynthesis monooxygenase Coq7
MSAGPLPPGRPLERLDRVIDSLDRGLRTVFSAAPARRPEPGAGLPEADLADAERDLGAALMRVNHTGEVCAQALYQGQLLTARDPGTRAVLSRAADEEMDHLAWTRSRIEALGGRTSVLDPLFYAGAFTLGALSGVAGDRWNLGFLAETERQVESHLEGHLERLPAADARSRAVLERMRDEEATHAETAIAQGGAELPAPVRLAMRLAAKVMTTATFRL